MWKKEPLHQDPGPSYSKRKREFRELLIPKLLAASDECKIKDHNAIHIMTDIKIKMVEY